MKFDDITEDGRLWAVRFVDEGEKDLEGFKDYITQN